MSVRLIARLGEIDPSVKPRQFRGLPPELTNGVDEREPLPFPRFVLIKQETEGVFLYRFTENGTCVGDTWHVSVEEAQEQARSEYGDTELDWMNVPETVTDELEYGRRLLT